jgi:hypothetical protein
VGSPDPALIFDSYRIWYSFRKLSSSTVDGTAAAAVELRITRVALQNRPTHATHRTSLSIECHLAALRRSKNRNASLIEKSESA